MCLAVSFATFLTRSDSRPRVPYSLPTLPSPRVTSFSVSPSSSIMRFCSCSALLARPESFASSTSIRVVGLTAAGKPGGYALTAPAPPNPPRELNTVTWASSARPDVPARPQGSSETMTEAGTAVCLQRAAAKANRAAGRGRRKLTLESCCARQNDNCYRAQRQRSDRTRRLEGGPEALPLLHRLCEGSTVREFTACVSKRVHCSSFRSKALPNFGFEKAMVCEGRGRG